MRQGARSAVVTADAEGAAVLAAGEPAEWIAAPRVAEVRNPIGAGDVLASALAAALERGEPLAAAAAPASPPPRRASSTRPPASSIPRAPRSSPTRS